ncbi:MAG: 30S ribosomal protein S9 [Anaerolineales bacterium]
MADQFYEGIGRRKTSTARVRVMGGAGAFMVNGKTLTDYFPRVGDAANVLTVLEDISAMGTVDVSAIVRGGGRTGQSGAVRMGLARALEKMNPEWHVTLAQAQHLRRDARAKERKKPGLKRARKAPTYTKR